MNNALQKHSTAWYDALDGYLRQRAARPFAWGRQDCCTYAADWVLLATGKDPMAGLRGLDTAVAARRTLQELGGMRAAWDARHRPHIAGPYAQAGDIAMVSLDGGGSAMAICTGAWLAVPGTDKVELLPITRAEATWRV